MLDMIGNVSLAESPSRAAVLSDCHNARVVQRQHYVQTGDDSADLTVDETWCVECLTACGTWRMPE